MDNVIKDSGKKIEHFNALDTGFCILTPRIFSVLEKNLLDGKTEWNDCVRQFLEEGIPTFDIKSNFWVGINTEEEFADAQKIIANLLQGNNFRALF